jgi:aryl-alcohol dehydrogenase-like predicted oxidoreductase
VSAGVDLFDTAAMYSGGASERRVCELAEGKRVVIATKFPPGWLSKAEALPDALDQSLGRLRRHHRPVSTPLPVPSHLDPGPDGTHGRRGRSGEGQAVGVSNHSAEQLRIAHAALAERGIPLASNQVEYSLLHRAPEVNGCWMPAGSWGSR